MKIELFDRILLTDGRKATVVEILGKNEMYICDVDLGDDWETIEVFPSQIKQLIT